MDQNYKAIIQGPKVEELARRSWKPGEVWVKIESVPINPIDMERIHAGEECKGINESQGVGFDAVGVIVDSNVDNCVDTENKLEGRQVAVYQTFFDQEYSGTWRQYIYCSLDEVYVLPKDSSSTTLYLGNPLTTLGLF